MTGIIEVPIYHAKYSQLPDGTLLQWGSFAITSGSYSRYSSTSWYFKAETFTFPVPFATTSYRGSGRCRWDNGSDFSISIQPLSETNAYIWVFDTRSRTCTSSNYTRVDWWAIGKWK